MKGTFVFVVCGAEEHIETLHFSLKYLKKYSKNEIIILTDASRNETPINHTNIIDVSTPEKYDHHQASIFLKTGIHHHLPKGKQYCYLDTDVIALSNGVDAIFEQFAAPIRFAPDHCVVSKFSPSAVNCTCLKGKMEVRQKLQKALDIYMVKGTPELEKKARLDKEFDRLKTDRLYKLKSDVKYALSRKKFQLNNEFWFDKKEGVWYDNDNARIMLDPNIAKIEQETGLKYNEKQQTWFDADGKDVWSDNCNHLIEQIQQKFNISVNNPDWQHWNGGVFLFNDQSHQFLEAWFGKTMEIFEDSEWRTRDQGTLIATVWEFGLHNLNPLNSKWNFIVDHTNSNGGLNEQTGVFTTDGFKTNYQPLFVHVYHHFGDTEWYIWNWIVDSFDKQIEDKA